MNRATRDKFASGTGPDLLSGNACWETPPAVFDKLNQDFGPFDLDLTADSTNHLCSVWFGPSSPVGQEDALSAVWSAHGQRGYSNSPYGPFVQRILARARYQAELGFVSTFLLPMRVTCAFREHIIGHAAQLLFCDKRITFYWGGQPHRNALTGHPEPALFDSIIVRFDSADWERHGLKVGIWNVPKHT